MAITAAVVIILWVAVAPFVNLAFILARSTGVVNETPASVALNALFKKIPRIPISHVAVFELMVAVAFLQGTVGRDVSSSILARFADRGELARVGIPHLRNHHLNCLQLLRADFQGTVHHTDTRLIVTSRMA